MAKLKIEEEDACLKPREDIRKEGEGVWITTCPFVKSKNNKKLTAIGLPKQSPTLVLTYPNAV